MAGEGHGAAPEHCAARALLQGAVGEARRLLVRRAGGVGLQDALHGVLREDVRRDREAHVRCAWEQ